MPVQPKWNRRMLGLIVLVGACETITPTPTIILSVGSQAVALTQGQSNTVAISVSRVEFPGSVSLAVTGLPEGVTGAFNPATLADEATTSTLTLSATNVASPGVATLTIEASGEGVKSMSSTIQLTVNVAGGFTVATPATATMAQGTNTTATITITRTGGFAQDVTLAATGLPTGVTASFSPSAASAGSSTLTLTASGSATAGTSSISITGTTPGLSAQSATLALTVQEAFTLSLTPASATVTQGGSTTATVSISRGAGFTGAVSLSATGLPSGVSAAFNPAETTGNSSTLTVSASGTASTGTTTVAIGGAATGVANRSTNLSLTTQIVTLTTLTLDYCSDFTPIWVAYQNQGGAWTRLTPDANGTVTFDATSKVAIYEVMQNGNSYPTSVLFATASELASVSGVTCPEQVGTKQLNGSVSGVGSGQFAEVSITGHRVELASTMTTFSFSTLPSTPVDVIATRKPPSSADPILSDRLIIRRGVNLPSGSTLPVLDFASSEAVTLTAANLTINGLTPGQANDASVWFYPTTKVATFGGKHLLWLSTATNGTAPFYSAPASLVTSSDIHELFVTGQSGTNVRAVLTYYRNASDKTVTLGPTLATPTLTQIVTSPYVRYRIQLPSQTEYNSFINVGFNQSRGDFWMTVTANYLDGLPATWDITAPDMSSAPQWQNTWGLQTGYSTDIFVAAMGGPNEILTGAVVSDGMTARIAEKSFPGTQLGIARGNSQDQIRTPRSLGERVRRWPQLQRIKRRR